MAIPSFQEMMLPMLQFAGDGAVWNMLLIRQHLAEHFQLSQQEQEELLPSGRGGRFANRVAWAKVYMTQAGLLASPGRGQFQITAQGQKVLADPPEEISIRYLQNFQGFKEFRSRTGRNEVLPVSDFRSDTPEEILEESYGTIRRTLALELLERVKACSPQFFEILVVDLLLKMGYGRAGEVVGKSGDEGIDGIISEDRLGLELVYLQAKRWEGTVGRPEVQKFVGALHGKRARKGVFITTGRFSSEAVTYVQNIDPRVALIDGAQLAEFMIDFNLGVAPTKSYELKSVDMDYFEL